MKTKVIKILLFFMLNIVLLCAKSFALLIPQATIISSIKQPIIKISTITKANNTKKINTSKPIITITVVKSKNTIITRNVIKKQKDNKKIYGNNWQKKEIIVKLNTTNDVNNYSNHKQNKQDSATFSVNNKSDFINSNKIKITVNGVKKENVNKNLLETSSVTLVDNRVVVDVNNEIFRSLGISVVRDKRLGLQSVIFIKGNKIIKLTESKHILTIDKKSFKVMDVVPFINSNGKLYIPIRYLLESFNVGINWNSNNQTIDILTA